jgi:hypothetical protein
MLIDLLNKLCEAKPSRLDSLGPGRYFGTNGSYKKEAIALNGYLSAVFKVLFPIVDFTVGHTSLIKHDGKNYSDVPNEEQRAHMDNNSVNIQCLDREKITKGYAEGLSAFIGMSPNNFMYVYTGFVDGKLVGKQLIRFKAGDLLVLKYGCLHNGVCNDSKTTTYKSFTPVAICLPTTCSQIWVVERDEVDGPEPGYYGLKQPIKF